MPTFDFPMLVWWGLPLAAAPLVIHLINLWRHKRVRFPAVEFLLTSQKKYRTRVLLRQLLLLLLRVVAVAGLVAAAAQPRWRDALGGLFGPARGRHVIVVDDSYSMQDRSDAGRLGTTTTFERAREAVVRLVADLAALPGNQEISVGRFSAVDRAGDTNRDDASRDAPRNDAPRNDVPRNDARWDIDRQLLAPEVVPRIRESLDRMQVGSLATGPSGPLARAAERLVGGRDEVGRDGAATVWVVSDFRARDWAAPAGAVAGLRRLAEAGVGIRLVDCGPTTAADRGDNLTLERIAVAGGVPAVGVLVPMELVVRNDGPQVARDVAVSLREDGATRAGVQLAEIPPQGTATARFDVRFTAPGSHLVEAELPADVVRADNTRGVVVEVADRAEVLLIDGDPRGGQREGDAFYVATALAPGPAAATGLRPRIEPPRALARLDLSAFDTVWILDCPRLDPAEITALEDYARQGGGVVFFTGPRTEPPVVNRLLHRGGEGLFPVPLAGAIELPPAAAGTPDIQADDHPVIAGLAGQRNPLLDAVRIDRVQAVAQSAAADSTLIDSPPNDSPPHDFSVRRLLAVRTGAPLIVERPFGAGRVAAVLTTAAPTWNNWSRGNPSWVVLLLELEAHLAQGRRQGTSQPVGSAVRVRLEPGDAAATVEFTLPDGTRVGQVPRVTDAGGPEAVLPDTTVPGGYTARWQAIDGAITERLFAVNVDPAEGQLAPVDRDGFARGLAGVDYTLVRADDLTASASTSASASLVWPLLLALLGVLIAEQVLAMFAGYHPTVPSTPHRAVLPPGRFAAGRGRPS
jgi:hypothetical protein